jgi:uridine kinase
MIDAFVIMKFGNKDLEKFYKNTIKPILLDSGYDPNRADELPPQEQILARIIHSIEDSGIIVCDLTSLNPNVMYELGVAHSLTRRVIMISQKGQILPFDLKDYEVLFYGLHDTQTEKDSFTTRFLNLLDAAGKDNLNNPVAVFSKLNNVLMNVKVNPSRRFHKPEAIVSSITNLIKAELKIKQHIPYIVAISGASGLGKSTFSQYLRDFCEENIKIRPSILSLDGYMLSRSKLVSNGISGYCKEAHDLIKLKRDLTTLTKEKRTISVPFFDHSTGFHSGSIQVEPSDILILDGVMAFCDEIEEFVDLNIFLDAKDKWTNMSLRFLVNLEQRGRSVSEARETAKREFNYYIRHLHIYKNKARIVVIVDNNWNMEFADWTPWGLSSQKTD